MIQILCEPGEEAVGSEIAEALRSAWDLAQAPEVLGAGAAWAGPAEWDDVLVVVYRTGALPPGAVNYIKAFAEAHRVSDPQTGEERMAGAFVPIALDAANRKPPEPISGIKALVYHRSDAGSKQSLVRDVGVYVGLELRPREQKVFVSYRAADGTALANGLYARLKEAGYPAWLDDADGNLATGSDVQRVIHERLREAALVVLLDTPQARESKWLFTEVRLAIAELVPVLPVVVGATALEVANSRFAALKSLQRRVSILRGSADLTPLTDAEWQTVGGEVEDLLLEAFQRRMKTVSRARKIFGEHSYDWKAVNEQKRMYRSQKPDPMLPASVLSHCSVHDVDYDPVLKTYQAFIDQYPQAGRVNHKVLIYDRNDVLTPAEIEDIRHRCPELSFILAHHNELGVLLGSNFTRLRP